MSNKLNKLKDKLVNAKNNVRTYLEGKSAKKDNQGKMLSILTEDAYKYPYNNKEDAQQDWDRAIYKRKKYYEENSKPQYVTQPVPSDLRLAAINDSLDGRTNSENVRKVKELQTPVKQDLFQPSDIPTIPDPRLNGDRASIRHRMHARSVYDIKRPFMGRPHILPMSINYYNPMTGKIEHESPRIALPIVSTGKGNKEYQQKHEYGHAGTLTENKTYGRNPQVYGNTIAPKIIPGGMGIRVPFTEREYEFMEYPSLVSEPDRQAAARTSDFFIPLEKTTDIVPRYGKNYKQFYTYFGAPEEFGTTAHNIKAILANNGIKSDIRHDFDKAIDTLNKLPETQLSADDKEFKADFFEVVGQLEAYKKRIKELQDTNGDPKLIQSLQQEYQQALKLYRHYFDLAQAQNSVGINYV